MSYLDKLAKFHRQQGTPMTRPPSFDKQPIDLYALKRAVDARGGFKTTCSDKKWAEVGRELGYAGIKNVTSVSTALKNAYQKYLLPYEMYLEKAKPDFLRELGLTPSPQQERKRDISNSSSGVVRNLMDQFKAEEKGDGMKEEMEDIKTESIADTNDMRDITPSGSQKGMKRSFEESTVRSSSISTENDKETEPARRESKRLKKGNHCT
jgi:histone demethylase JARID1